MHDVQSSPGDRGCSDDFLGGLDCRSGLNVPGATHVSIDRHLALGRHSEDVNDLETGGAWGVLNAHADAESAGIKLVAQTLPNALDLFGRGGLISGGAPFWPKGFVGEKGAGH